MNKKEATQFRESILAQLPDGYGCSPVTCIDVVAQINGHKFIQEQATFFVLRLEPDQFIDPPLQYIDTPQAWYRLVQFMHEFIHKQRHDFDELAERAQVTAW